MKNDIQSQREYYEWHKYISSKYIFESELEISVFYLVPEHFRCPKWPKSIAYDPALDDFAMIIVGKKISFFLLTPGFLVNGSN